MNLYQKESKTKTFCLQNFIKFYKIWKNKLCKRRGSKTKERKSETNNKRTAKRMAWTRKKRGQGKFTYEKSQVLPVTRVAMPFKAWSTHALQHVIVLFIMTIKIEIYDDNQPNDPRLHLFSCLSACPHQLPCFPEGASKPASSLHYV